MVNKTEKLHHKKEVQIAIVAIFIVALLVAGMDFQDLLSLRSFIGIDTFQDSLVTLFDEGFAQFGILAAFVYGFLPVTLMKLGITGIVVRVLDLGISPLFLILFFSLGRLIGQGILYGVGKYTYRIFKGQHRSLVDAEHILHKYKIVIYLATPLLGSIGDLIMLVSGHQRIGFMKIAILLYIGNVISTSIWIYWTVATINLPALFT